jgi:phage head maturation protease
VTAERRPVGVPTRDYRQLLDIDIPEVSIVAFPAYRGTGVSARSLTARPRPPGDRAGRDDTAELARRGIVISAGRQDDDTARLLARGILEAA